jgi:hypothetical protein
LVKRNRRASTYHIAVTFELIAMLAKSVHIPGSRFRRLLNPCADAWTPVLDAAAYLSAFATNIHNRPTLGSHILTTEVRNWFEHGHLDNLLLGNRQSLAQKINPYADASTGLADERDHKDYYYLDHKWMGPAARNYDARLRDLLDSLHWAVERVDEMLHDMINTPGFHEVITLHFEAVLDCQRELNSEMAGATRDYPKEKILINFHFNNIHPVAAKVSAEQASGEAVLALPISEERSAIWLGLMFRMWSWLFLHDFNPEDKMIERSEYMNKRLPVYIS